MNSTAGSRTILVFFSGLALVLAALGGWYFYSQRTSSYTGPTAQITELTSATFIQKYSTFTDGSYDDTKPVLIFDLRDKSDYEAGHVKGALSLPFSIVEKNDYNVPSDKRLIFYLGKKISKTQLAQSLGGKGITAIELIPTTYNDWANQVASDTGNPPIYGEE